MSVSVETRSWSDAVLVAFDQRMDACSLAQCANQFDRIPHIWWKHVTVELRRIKELDSDAIDFLRYLKERASGCNLRLVQCQPQVARALEDAALQSPLSAVIRASRASSLPTDARW